MNFKTETTVAASRQELWGILFDVERVAAMIPGCEEVQEHSFREHYSAVIKQKLGPFKFHMPSEVSVVEYVENERVAVKANGKDKKTGTQALVDLLLMIEAGEPEEGCKLQIDAEIQISGKLATLGFPVVKKRCNEIFAEFEANLKTALEGINET